MDILWIFILIVILMICKVLFQIKETFDIPEYLNHKSKCFTCETDMRNRYGDDGAWLANPSKTYSAEIDSIRQAGGNIAGGFLAKSVKYY
jgi:hypothetical protein